MTGDPGDSQKPSVSADIYVGIAAKTWANGIAAIATLGMSAVTENATEQRREEARHEREEAHAKLDRDRGMGLVSAFDPGPDLALANLFRR